LIQGKEVTGRWIKLHSETYDNLFSSHNIVRVINLRKVRWMGY